MIIKFLKRLFRTEPKPPKFAVGDLVVFEAEHKNCSIDYQGIVRSFDPKQEIIAIQLTVIPKAPSAASGRWPEGYVLTIRKSHREYNTLIVLEKAANRTGQGS